MTSFKRWIVPTAILTIIIVVVAIFMIQTRNEVTSATGPAPTLPTLPVPTEETSTPTPTPTPTPECEGPDTLFNLEGEAKASLLPDCGNAPVTVAEQQISGLTLGCGGKYPSILFKTNTGDTNVSVCGKDASGVEFRVVVKERGAELKDLKGDYIWQRDAFVAKDGGVTYEIRGYDGSVHITRNGKTTVQETDDWMSLENEPDDG